jgi:hypothetical protein
MRELGRVDSTCFVLVGWMALMQQRERDWLLTCDVYMVACASSSRVRFPAKPLDAIILHYVPTGKCHICWAIVLLYANPPQARGCNHTVVGIG